MPRARRRGRHQVACAGIRPRLRLRLPLAAAIDLSIQSASLQRLVVVALRAIAIQVADVARPLLEPLAIDRVDAGLARRRGVRLHARRQHRQRRRDAEHLQVVVVARRGLVAVRVQPVVGQADERLAVGVRLRVRAVAVLQDERRPAVAEIDVEQPRRARRRDRVAPGDAAFVDVGLAGGERGDRLRAPGSAGAPACGAGAARAARRVVVACTLAAPRPPRRTAPAAEHAPPARDPSHSAHSRESSATARVGARYLLPARFVSRGSSRTEGRARSRPCAGARSPTAGRRGSCPTRAARRPGSAPAP